MPQAPWRSPPTIARLTEGLCPGCSEGFDEGMQIRVVDTENGFDALEEEWNRLAEKTSASVFSSFDYVRVAWKHFHNPTDRLFILVLSDGPAVLGIAPFCVRRSAIRGIPYRVIRFIAAWEGDRPRILAEKGEEAFYERILVFLSENERSWEVLDLIEQPLEGPEGRAWPFLLRSGWYWEKQADVVDYYISVRGPWEEYLKSLGSATQRNWRRQTKRLASLPGGYRVEQVSEPARMGEALSRYVAIERSGWKAKAGIGVAKDDRHLAFYEELLVRLAGKGQAQVFFLISGAEDMASAVQFLGQGVTYGRHTAFAPAYATYSPAVVLHAEIFRDAFERAFREVDLLSMKEDGKPEKHKTDWATGRKKTVRWTGYRVGSRLLPLILAKRIKRFFGRTPGEEAAALDPDA